MNNPRTTMSDYPQEVIDTLRNVVKTQSELLALKEDRIDRLLATIDDARLQIKILKGES
jgi:hypothetical protein